MTLGKALLNVGEKVCRDLICRPISAVKKQNICGSVFRETMLDSTDSLGYEEGQRFIFQAIKSGGPFLAARFGSTELRAVMRHLARADPNVGRRLLRFFSYGDYPIGATLQARRLQNLSGFFPINRPSLERFTQTYVSSMPEIDLLGSWVPGENIFREQLSNATVTALESLEPFFSETPWTLALEGKKVLVVHPFVRLFEEQYARRLDIFPSSPMLPKFDFVGLRAVQSLGGEVQGFASWFDALSHMEREALREDFDVAIIGAGSYGLPLGARLKRKGKTVIHLGGVTQLLFGVIGERWSNRARYSALFNENWVRPQSSYRPANWQNVDQGAYW